MRKIISYFIKYHVAVNVIVLAFFVLGIAGALSLKSSFFPLVDSKNISINIVYPGASPQEIEEGIVLKIEDNLKGLKGIDRVTSVSRENSGTINVEIEKGEDIDFMLLEVKNAVDRVPTFPTGMEPLIVAKQEAIRQTIEFTISGENIPLATLKQIGRQVENDLRAIPGISQIGINGYPDEEIEIAVNENSLLAYDLTFAEVSQAVSRANILTTGGTIKTAEEEYLIRANNRSYYGDELSNIIVRATNTGQTVRLKDVAIIRDRFSETPNANYFNGDLSVNIVITSTNNEDLITSAQSVKDYMEDFNAKYNNVQLNVVSDSSKTLTQRTRLLAENAFAGIVLVLFFLSLFLNSRLAFWVAFGLIVAFLGMFMFAPYFNVTINVLSLFGMIIVIGILVDDGIVIAENIYQHYEKGKSPIQAAIDGTLEVMPPIVSAIITTLIAFGIFLFLDGRIGDFFGEVSVVVILTLSISLVEALIILPAHLAHSKALHKQTKPKTQIAKLFSKLRQVNAFGDRIMRYMREKWYGPALKFTLKYKLLTFSFFVMALVLTFGSIGGGIVRTSFFPQIASDRVSVTLAMPNGTNEFVTDSIISFIEQKAWEVNEELTEEYIEGEDKMLVENIIKIVGPGSSNASLNINLLPGEERPDEVTSNVVSSRLREKVGPVFGAETLIFGSGGNFGGRPVSVSLLGNNIAELKAAKDELKREMVSNPQLKDVTDNDPAGIKEIRLELKENAYLLGLNLRDVMAEVRSAFFGVQAQRFQRGQDEIRVWVRYDRPNRSSIKSLDNMRITTPAGSRIPLNEIAEYSIERGDVAINHLEGRREIQISADLKDPQNDSSTEIMNDIRTVVMPEILSKYPTVSPSFEGQNREAGKLTSSLKPVGLTALLLIYIVIAFTFRSYSQPLLLILLVPFSLTAVSWGHWFHGFPINILSMLGIIALIGIMVNDGLVLIGKFNINLREGMSFDDAIYAAGKSRFRAIFLTSLTTIAGLTPLIFEKSRQAQFLKPMAISIAYGIGFATLLTLLMLPLFLSVNNNLKVNVKWLITGKKVSKEEVERAIMEQKEEETYGSDKDDRIETNSKEAS
ncbi:efflux RND transporter permease subunit [Aureitalea sp. L0-47]|uniref:efflux RND transporter permease subunit n=1 Tax=Aureitalea sp. L0-47 TaxID=2816962 RepID=UPI0022381A4E|nr:efflux RND transporter permease subunit [Aureitalea sp. L0-47]MCW5518745.1 efflux RND transporter permease subunit [Aureitalea sp. L0-47]